MSERECPVQPPKLLRAESRVETCAHCGAWVERYPAFLGSNDGFWQCERCGSSAVEIRDGRPYAPKSKEWKWVVAQFNKLYLHIAPWDRDTVTTDPPMNSLNWGAVEAWWNEQGIYNVYIHVEEVQGDEN